MQGKAGVIPPAESPHTGERVVGWTDGALGGMKVCRRAGPTFFSQVLEVDRGHMPLPRLKEMPFAYTAWP